MTPNDLVFKIARVAPGGAFFAKIMELNESQRRAVDQLGNTVVMAGAGTGKTRTLVERCVRLLLDPAEPVSIEEMLIVTFTEAAATELKGRIRERLLEEAEKGLQDGRIEEQLILLERAWISTIHSFCLRVIRANALQIGLAPGVEVIDSSASGRLKRLILGELLERHAANPGPGRDYLLDAEQGGVHAASEWIPRLHEFAVSRADGTRWLESQRAALADPDPTYWREAFSTFCLDWRDACLESLGRLPEGENGRNEFVGDLKRLDPPDALELSEWLGLLATHAWPYGQKSNRHPLFKLIEKEAGFLKQLCPDEGGRDPMAEDWRILRSPLAALFGLCLEFADDYANAKLARGSLDFADCEQFALRLLMNPVSDAPSPEAVRLRSRFKFVFVDEYQDTNPVQDAVIRAVTRSESPGNLFLVGDIKQSIYRFRQADPGIFRGYASRCLGSSPWGSLVHLSENYRTLPAVLDFVNPFFEWLFAPGIEGVEYGPDERLVPTRSSQPSPKPEVHLLVEDSEEGAEEADESDDASDNVVADKTEAEAHLAASLLKRMHDDPHAVWDEEHSTWRPARWSEMCLLVAAPRSVAEAFSKVFAAWGIPLNTRCGSLTGSIEVLDWLNLLGVLDNPMQDIPLLSVLRSPIGGLDDIALADIRVCSRNESFWSALKSFHETASAHPAWKKVDQFLERARRWTSHASSNSLGDALADFIEEAGYWTWLKGQTRAAQRRGNLRHLIELASGFQFNTEARLASFLDFIREVDEEGGGIEPPFAGDSDAVLLSSIHQSKGLEYPVVLVAGLGRRFNLVESSARRMIHPRFGLCSGVQPPGAAGYYSSFPLWLGARESRAGLKAEQLRLLYVALTRARDRLLLLGSTSEKSFEKWSDDPRPRGGMDWSAGSSFLDWLGAWLIERSSGRVAEHRQGEAGEFHWRIHATPPVAVKPPPVPALSPVVPREFPDYPHAVTGQLPAKATVTALRKSLGAGAEPVVRIQSEIPRRGGEEALRSGKATHRFLQFLDLASGSSVAALRSIAREMEEQGLLERDDMQQVNFSAVSAFLASPEGQSIRSMRERVHREMPFTFRLEAYHVAALGLIQFAALPEGEFVIVQGVVDLAVILEKEVWILDFKTDQIAPDDAPARGEAYFLQLALYSRAMSAVTGKPVTHLWLHFLTARRTIDFANSPELSDPPAVPRADVV